MHQAQPGRLAYRRCQHVRANTKPPSSPFQHIGTESAFSQLVQLQQWQQNNHHLCSITKAQLNHPPTHCFKSKSTLFLCTVIMCTTAQHCLHTLSGLHCTQTCQPAPTADTHIQPCKCHMYVYNCNNHKVLQHSTPFPLFSSWGSTEACSAAFPPYSVCKAVQSCPDACSKQGTYDSHPARTTPHVP